MGLKLPDICLKGEEKHRKNLTQETCPDRRSNPSPLHERRATIVCSTAVDDLRIINDKNDDNVSMTRIFRYL